MKTWGRFVRLSTKPQLPLQAKNATSQFHVIDSPTPWIFFFFTSEGFRTVIVLFKKEDLEEPRRSVNLGIPVMEKLEILKVVADMAEKESARTWTRYAMMLYASIGLLATLFLTLKVGMLWVAAVPSVIGIIVSIAWLKINAFSGSYTKRLHGDMEALVKSDETLQEWVRATNLPEIRQPFASRKTRFYFNLLPNAFLGIWSFILFAALTSGLWRSPQGVVSVDIPRGSQAYVDDRAPATGLEQGRQDKGAGRDGVFAGSPEGRPGNLDAEGRRSENQVIAREHQGPPKRSAREIRAEKVKMGGAEEKDRESGLRIAPDSIPF